MEDAGTFAYERNATNACLTELLKPAAKESLIHPHWFPIQCRYKPQDFNFDDRWQNSGMHNKVAFSILYLAKCYYRHRCVTHFYGNALLSNLPVILAAIIIHTPLI